MSMRIALYIGNELYPGTYDPSTITILQQSPLTSPILCLLNQSAKDPTVLVYNDHDNPVFDTSGYYIGSPKWPDVLRQLRGGNIKEVYLSFSTNGTEYMHDLLKHNPAAAQSILSNIKNELFFDGIDLDYEGPDFDPKTSPLYPLAEAAVEVGLKLTAAPYFDQTGWQSWVEHVQSKKGTVSWLNLQCYAGGIGNSPGDWLNTGAPIVPGSCSSCGGPQTTCSPQDMQNLFTLWAQGEGHAPLPPTTCWDGVPNKGALPIDGGFIWVYSSIKGLEFSDYMNAVATGLGV